MTRRCVFPSARRKCQDILCMLFPSAHLLLLFQVSVDVSVLLKRLCNSADMCRGLIFGGVEFSHFLAEWPRIVVRPMI